MQMRVCDLHVALLYIELEIDSQIYYSVFSSSFSFTRCSKVIEKHLQR